MRALIPREGAAPVRERLLMTLFIAALIHGMIILGVTFAGSSGHGASRGLDVLLVSDELPTADHNDSAAYLAQRTQLGSGNTRTPTAVHNEASVTARPPHAGVDQGEDPNSDLTSSPASAAPAAHADQRADERVLTTTAPRVDIRYFAPSQDPDGTTPQQPLAAQTPPAPRPGDPGPVQLRGVQRNELWITPDTRESILAPYLDSWRRRVERIGTVNYPTAAEHAGVRASPVLEVAIDSDGRLSKARIMTSSGYPDLDAAALAILKLASPFAPFPPDLAARYHTLRFAYEWQFTGGRVAKGAVAAVP